MSKLPVFERFLSVGNLKPKVFYLIVPQRRGDPGVPHRAGDRHRDAQRRQLPPVLNDQNREQNFNGKTQSSRVFNRMMRERERERTAVSADDLTCLCQKAQSKEI